MWTAVAVLLAGCYPASRMQTPRTVPPGRLHVALGAAFTHQGAHDLHPEALVAPDLALRLGVLDRLDLSLRVRPGAAELGPKLQLLRDELEVSLATSAIAASEMGSVGDAAAYADRNVEVLAARAALLVGSDASAPFAFWIAPAVDAGSRSFHDYGGAYEEPFAAVGVSCAINVAWTDWARLQLETGVLVPVAGQGVLRTDDAERAVQTRLGPGDERLELNLAFLFGSFEED